MARPSSFTQEIADKICDMLALDNSLASICEPEDMPSTTTVYRWKAVNDQFRDDYTRARTDQGHTAADTVGDIRRKILSGELDWQTGKAAADLAKWDASKRAARDFGDRLDLTSGGETIVPDDTAVAARVAAMLQTALARDEPE